MSTTLTIRNLAESTKRQLRMQAASHGRSMEAEAREILTRAVATPGPSSPAVVTDEPEKGARAAVRGLWKGKMTTDELMELTRGDDIDDAYTRR